VLRWLFSFIAAPLVGLVAGALAVFLVEPRAAVLAGTFVVVGAFLAVPAAVVIGLPIVLLARNGRALRLPSLLLVGVPAASGITLVANCLLLSCVAGPWFSYLFAVVCAVATAVLLHLLLPRENAL
jgi:hypothetical protein